MNSKGLDRQNALIDRMESEPIFCPVCKKSHSVKDARLITGSPASANFGKHVEFVCPNTSTALHHGVELFGGDQFWSRL